MKILFLIPYPLGESPSQRFRFEQYFTFLSQKSIAYTVKSFLEPESWRVFYKRGSVFFKAKVIIGGFWRRLLTLSQIADYDFVFIHREAAPIGPPVIEWIIAKILKKKIIYDFDDAIWLTDKKNESLLEKSIRWRGKVEWICKWSYKISAGNSYLANFARKQNENVFINPTTIDTEMTHNADRHLKGPSGGRMIIGWTGSHSTLKYLKALESTLHHLEEKFEYIDFWVIADKAPDIRLPRLYFKPWSLETEVLDLAQFDIGIMPLPDDEWTKGKCGFKALQYMAMRIPTVASAIGLNKDIIKHGVNGYLVNNVAEWDWSLSKLIENESLRQELGNEGRKTVVKFYSIHSNKENFLSLFL